jgi:hypothetical protein
MKGALHKLVYLKLKEKVESGEIQFGFNTPIKEFTLESYEEKHGDVIYCICKYIENGEVFQKYCELVI